MPKKILSIVATTLFIILCLVYFIDSLIAFSFQSKRNLLFMFGVIFIIFIYLLIKENREILLISIISIISFDLFFNFFLQDKFYNIKVKPIIKNSIQLSADYLNDWPYFKLKPNIIARTYGDRGEDCVYEWKTDKLGFKNLKVEDDYDFVTLGNSYVEGMCAGIDETIAHYLSKNMIKTYNLAVQGWSDRQAISALNILKDEKISYKGVIFGYLQNRFYRERNFLTQPKQAGGLGVIIENDLRKDKSYFVSRQIIQSIFSRNKFNWEKQFSEKKVNKYTNNFKIKEKYKDIKLPINYFPSQQIWSDRFNIDYNNNKLLDISNKAILSLANDLKEEEKKFIIFIFPQRSDVLGHIIYEDGYICKTDHFKSYINIKKNLKNTDYVMIDFFDEVVELTKKFLRTRDYDFFIWKYKDIHYSKIGNQLTANAIKKYLDTGQKGTKNYLKNCN